MFMRCDNLNSYQHSHFATVDGRVAGLTYAFHQRQKVALGKKSDALMLRYAGFALPRMLLLGFRLHSLTSFMDAVPPDVYYLQGLAVYPQYRGQGIGKMLLEKSEQLACAATARSLELDVETDNYGAIRVYEKAGMYIKASSAEVWFRNQNRHIKLHRMAKALASDP